MKNVGVPLTPLVTPLEKSSRTRGAARARQLAVEALHLQAQIFAYCEQLASLQRVAGARRCSRASPRTFPARRRLGGLRGVLGVRVDLRQREVAEYESQARAEAPLHLLDDRVGPAAVRTFVVAVLDQRDRRVGGPCA